MSLQDVMHTTSRLFEIAGMACIVGGFAVALLRTISPLRAKDSATAYRVLRETFGRSVLLGLEILVAADLIRTITVKPTFENIGVLGLLVAIRTFLSWSLEVEIDGRWPWKRPQPQPTDAP